MNAKVGNLLNKLSEKFVIKSGLIIYPGRVAQPGEEVAIASGSGFKLQIVSDAFGYLYIFQLDSHGNLYQLFPNNGDMGRQNPLEPDTVYQIPKEKDDWFVLDQKTGNETIFLIASR